MVLSPTKQAFPDQSIKRLELELELRRLELQDKASEREAAARLKEQEFRESQSVSTPSDGPEVSGAPELSSVGIADGDKADTPAANLRSPRPITSLLHKGSKSVA
ncbi:unnamed protein product [Boreogadus saida]